MPLARIYPEAVSQSSAAWKRLPAVAAFVIAAPDGFLALVGRMPDLSRKRSRTDCADLAGE